MTIQELQEKKEELHSDISQLLIEFHQITNVQVLELNARLSDIYIPNVNSNNQLERHTNYQIDIELNL